MLAVVVVGALRDIHELERALPCQGEENYIFGVTTLPSNYRVKNDVALRRLHGLPMRHKLLALRVAQYTAHTRSQFRSCDLQEGRDVVRELRACVSASRVDILPSGSIRIREQVEVGTLQASSSHIDTRPLILHVPSGTQLQSLYFVVVRYIATRYFHYVAKKDAAKVRYQHRNADSAGELDSLRGALQSTEQDPESHGIENQHQQSDNNHGNYILPISFVSGGTI
jgi:hypothetical protein